MLNKLLKNNIFLTFFVSIIVFGIIYTFSLNFQNIDKNLSDKLYYYNFDEFINETSSDIIVVGIDEKTVGKNGLGRFPFSRDKYIKVIENLNKDGAEIIAFDIIFADITDDEIDKTFAKAIKKAGNIVLGGGTIDEGGLRVYEKPLKIFENASLLNGYFFPKYDPDNKIVYSIEPTVQFKNGPFYHFGIQVLRAYFYKIYGEKEEYLQYFEIKNGSLYLTPEIKIPYNINKQKEININYTFDDIFNRESFLNVYNNKFEKGKFKNKIVIIGATAKGIKDVFNSPYGVKYGVYTHANLINTVLTKQYKINFNKNLEYLLIFFLILLSVYFNLTQRGKHLLISNLTIIASFTITLSYITTVMRTPLNFPIQFILSVILTLTVSNILKSFMEDKNKTILNKALSQYVSKDIAEEILSGEGKIKLDGERKRISIFFSDIEGFTSISEKMNPEELVIFLREYLGAMSNIIMDERGFIDKYEGDAIMALWGVFKYEDSSTYDNCISALKQKESLKKLNIEWKKRFGEELKIRMGLHTGDAIVGNIGAAGRKMDFTALGDSVNLASRLEEVNKKYGTYLCVSEVVYLEQKENFDFRYLDQIKVKGKNIPVKIYELISIKGEINDLQKSIVNKFEKAIKLYLNKEFKTALNIFEELSLLGDNPSKTYISRCEIFIKNSPEKSWDGVWTMKTK